NRLIESTISLSEFLEVFRLGDIWHIPVFGSTRLRVVSIESPKSNIANDEKDGHWHLPNLWIALRNDLSSTDVLHVETSVQFLLKYGVLENHNDFKKDLYLTNMLRIGSLITCVNLQTHQWFTAVIVSCHLPIFNGSETDANAVDTDSKTLQMVEICGAVLEDTEHPVALNALNLQHFASHWAVIEWKLVNMLKQHLFCQFVSHLFESDGNSKIEFKHNVCLELLEKFFQEEQPFNLDMTSDHKFGVMCVCCDKQMLMDFYYGSIYTTTRLNHGAVFHNKRSYQYVTFTLPLNIQFQTEHSTLRSVDLSLATS
ncbi:hypothetical protein RFI_32826, partial [Reticulomyxa filosa]